jgi:acetyltransferase-like isoleucine patch superfamily enzyme
MGSPSLGQSNGLAGIHLMAPDDLVIAGDGRVEFEHDIICGKNVRVIAEGRDIRIGARVWLGDNATIRASVGTNCIVSSNSEVLEDVVPNIVVDGKPAKFVWQIC